jgi:SagB-type dehydrogenase family enzyme
MAGREPLFRRSPCVVAYWSGDGIVFHNFATGEIVPGTALTIGLLDYFSSWRSAAGLLDASALPSHDLHQAIITLHDKSLLQRSDRPPPPAETAMEAWRSWNPAAGLFHFTTKDVPFTDIDEANRWLSSRASERPSPPVSKHYDSRRSIRLPRARLAGSLRQALLARRTWRRFGPAALSRARLGTLLDLTFGVRHWWDLGLAGRAMLRTSPSAGARNPLECYVVVRSVTNVPAQVYHYAPADHALVPIGPAPRPFGDYLPGQPWYSNAAVLVVMTAVFARVEWKYPFARAYRTVLLEAGHFAQTFCLIATALGVAPFCTAALADSLIEHDLAIDGVSESVIYACGVGTRPRGAVWAPWPDTTAVPPLVPPKPARRSRHS